MAAGMARKLDAPVYVSNIPGGSGTAGTRVASLSAPDGRTMVLGISATMAIAPAVFKDPGYRPESDFVPLARIGHAGLVLIARGDYPASNLAQLIALARRSSIPTAYGSWGVGTGGHIAAESIRTATGIPLTHVPYKGVAAMIHDMLGGHIRVGMADIGSALPMLKSGKLKALALTADKRSSALPAVPTFKESGVQFDSESWYGLFVPARTPSGIVSRLTDAARAVLDEHSSERFLSKLGIESDHIVPREFAQEWHRDTLHWAALVRQAGIAPQ
jgi:tripartite-type tricarboxylate transporter receptor subunit TctC